METILTDKAPQLLGYVLNFVGSVTSRFGIVFVVYLGDGVAHRAAPMRFAKRWVRYRRALPYRQPFSGRTFLIGGNMKTQI